MKTFKGKPITLLGETKKIGDIAPDFHALNTKSEVKSLKDYKSRYIILNVVPSLDTTVCDLQARTVNSELAEREDISGIIITHGTDTLEETAYFLDLALCIKKPVVVVGAMRNSSELGYDGSSNLAAAVCTAISPNAVGKGVLVVLNNEVNTAREVTKTNTMSLNTFQSSYGPIGIIDTNEFIIHRNITVRDFIETDKIEKNVVLIKSCMDMGTDILDFCIDKGSRGIVIEAMGRGNLPPDLVPSIKRAISKNIAVVIVSRCHSGRVMSSYGYPGG